ncbi:adaptin ear-binding coat-associated protein 2 [Immersiella caudata]|uniref:Adaptin ear-binding coat-associated protein 2 n=1 Tax=Immersiella caudata TaxID=314043 RepID=A0AA40C0A7_9PEZI|nr:adaptin ear-binding coat-associated protein 2 [Immersiella caudata]
MENSTLDPATGQPLPPDAIQRILHIASPIHVYSIPPVSSSRGHLAASWTAEPQRHIFTCRLRVIETAFTPSDSSSETVKVDIILEDPSTGSLFAAAPYTTRAVVEPAADSSRFFAVRVQDPSGRKATLGIGFEERSEAFDFGVALQEAEKAVQGGSGEVKGKEAEKKKEEEVKRDYSLKEGETITVNLSGTKFGKNRIRPPPAASGSSGGGEGKRSGGSGKSLASFALPPPPGSGGNGFLPPPPSAQEVRKQKRLSSQQLGFDDGENGEFA